MLQLLADVGPLSRFKKDVHRFAARAFNTVLLAGH
jgi:hypothetical protein